jgi:hypothetical protein
MANIFCTKLPIQLRYDLKGCTKGRTVGAAAAKVGAGNRTVGAAAVRVGAGGQELLVCTCESAIHDISWSSCLPLYLTSVHLYTALSPR